MTEEMVHLQSIEQILKNEGFDCCVDPEDVAPPFGRILLFLGKAREEGELILEITTQHQELGESLRDPPELPQYMRTQFQLAFPFDALPASGNDIACLLAFLNRTLELPGFEFDEMHHKIFYRYVLLHKRGDFDKTLLLGVVGVALMLCNVFAETIESIAQGKSSFNDLLEELGQLSKKIY